MLLCEERVTLDNVCELLAALSTVVNLRAAWDNSKWRLYMSRLFVAGYYTTYKNRIAKRDDLGQKMEAVFHDPYQQGWD